LISGWQKSTIGIREQTAFADRTPIWHLKYWCIRDTIDQSIGIGVILIGRYLLGVLLFEMLYKIPPYFHPEKEVMYKNIMNAKLTFKETTSPELSDFISRLLERNPENRLGYEFGAREIKGHPFFSNIEWDEVYEKYLKWGLISEN
jgi:serine/threonine protein kinase